MLQALPAGGQWASQTPSLIGPKAHGISHYGIMSRDTAPMTKLPPAFLSRARSLASGANDSLRNAWLVWRMNHEPGGRPFFPPEVVVQVKALACELPAQTDLPRKVKKLICLRLRPLEIGVKLLWQNNLT
jgi:hypothetical protein